MQAVASSAETSEETLQEAIDRATAAADTAAEARSEAAEAQDAYFTAIDAYMENLITDGDLGESLHCGPILDLRLCRVGESRTTDRTEVHRGDHEDGLPDLHVLDPTRMEGIIRTTWDLAKHWSSPWTRFTLNRYNLVTNSHLPHRVSLPFDRNTNTSLVLAPGMGECMGLNDGEDRKVYVLPHTFSNTPYAHQAVQVMHTALHEALHSRWSAWDNTVPLNEGNVTSREKGEELNLHEKVKQVYDDAMKNS